MTPFCIRSRREFLGLSLDELSEITLIHSAVLRSIEDELPASKHLDERLEAALFLQPGVLRGQIPLNDDIYSISGDARDILTRLLSRLPVDKKVRELEMVEKIEILFEYYGLWTGTPTPLKDIALDFEVTQKSIKKLVRLLKWAAEETLEYSPAFSRVRRDVCRLLPAPTEFITRQIKQANGLPVPLEAVNEFCSDFLRKPIFRDINGVAYDPSDESGIAEATAAAKERIAAERAAAAAQKRLAASFTPFKQLVHVASKIVVAAVRQNGVANLEFVAHAASRSLGYLIAPASVEKALLCRHSHFEWLDQAKGLFWLGPVRPSFLKSWVLKLFVAAECPVSVEEVKDSLRRYISRPAGPYKSAQVPLPDNIIAAVLARFPELKYADSGRFELNPKNALNREQILSRAEQLIIDHMRQRDGVSLRDELLRDLVDKGVIGSNTLTQVLLTSPVFKSLTAQHWTFYGSEVYKQARPVLEAVE